VATARAGAAALSSRTLSLPGAISTLLDTGMGGAAIGIALFAMLGGVSLSGRGPLWLRLVCGAAAFWLVPAAFLGPLQPPIDRYLAAPTGPPSCMGLTRL
jgi:hypothetical protein